MDALFIILGILVLSLLGMLLWFVPHLLQQQASRVAGETGQLREMLLDLLNEQEAVTLRQTQLGGSLSGLREHLEVMAKNGTPVTANAQVDQELQQVETHIRDMQAQLQEWMRQRDAMARTQSDHDNESWGNLMTLLAAMQERIGELSRDRSPAYVTSQASQMLHDLEQEMERLRGISEDIERLQWRLRRSLHEREAGAPYARSQMNGASY